MNFPTGSKEESLNVSLFVDVDDLSSFLFLFFGENFLCRAHPATDSTITPDMVRTLETLIILIYVGFAKLFNKAW